MTKEKKTKQEERDEQMKRDYNQGRLNCDHKWINAIEDRIEELEKEVGIPELKKLKKDVMYRWKEDD